MDKGSALRLEALLHVASLDSLYKYGSAEKCISQLENSELQFNTPLSFNDIYDCDPSLITFGDDFVLNVIRKEPKYKYLLSNKNFKNTPLYKSTMEGFRKTKGKIIRNQILTKVGISCFTETKHHPLMWANYARNHTGVCIEFDPKKLIIALSQIDKTDRSKSSIFLKVNYENVRENLTYGLTETQWTLMMWLKTKSIEWQYENEIRLLILQWEQNSIKVTPDVVKTIYLGSRIDAKHEEKIKTIREINFPNASMIKMGLSDNDFGLIEQPIHT